MGGLEARTAEGWGAEAASIAALRAFSWAMDIGPSSSSSSTCSSNFEGIATCGETLGISAAGEKRQGATGAGIAGVIAACGGGVGTVVAGEGEAAGAAAVGDVSDFGATLKKDMSVFF